MSLTVTGSPADYDPSSDNDLDEIPNGWENHFGLDMDDPSDASGDLDQDNFTNLEEYQASTLPNDLTSHPVINEGIPSSGSQGNLDWGDCEFHNITLMPGDIAAQSCSIDYSLVTYNCRQAGDYRCQLTDPNTLQVKQGATAMFTQDPAASMKCCRVGN